MLSGPVVLMTELQTEMNRMCFLDKQTKKTDLFFDQQMHCVVLLLNGVTLQRGQSGGDRLATELMATPSDRTSK